MTRLRAAAANLAYGAAYLAVTACACALAVATVTDRAVRQARSTPQPNRRHQ